MLDEPPINTNRQSRSEDLMYRYLADIGKHPLLTKEDEVTLGTLIQEGIEASERFKTGTLTPTQRRKALAQIAAGEEATTKFVNANLRLVVSIAKRYNRRSELPLLDLIQEGNLGLLRAVEKFDARKGFKFSTYATWWIKQAITRGIQNTSRTIRIPNHTEELIRQIDRTSIAFETRNHRTPTTEEIAEEVGADIRRINDSQRAARVVTSIDLTVGEDVDITFGEIVAVADDDTSAQGTLNVIREAVQHSLMQLDPREREILTLRFGLDRGEPRTLQEVADNIGVTRERIRQIETRAIAKLRHPTVRSALRDLAS